MAFRRRFRRRFNGLWLQTPGGIALTTGIGAGGDAPTIVSTTLVDGNVPYNESTVPTASSNAGGIALQTRQGFQVKRIVGSVFIAGAESSLSSVATAIVTAGIFVERVDQDGTLQNFQAWNPCLQDSQQKRWLWQRSWLIGNAAYETGTDGSFDTPHSNAEYGDIRSGPHVDVKVGARVGYEEALFFCLSGFSVSDIGQLEGLFSVTAFAKLRVFGKGASYTNR